MSLACDGCGEPIGHADEICKEYKELGIKSFGRRECQRIFEDHHDIEPCVRCDNCNELVEESEAEKALYDNNGLTLKAEIHPDCRTEFFEDKEEVES